ncbi:MAG: flagellar motor protein MotB [Miltoncostaeaceae bacterium]
MARRKKSHEDEHPDERWLITYADLLTLMFVLFMVLFSISVVNTSKFEQLKETLQNSFSAGVADGGDGVLQEVARVAGIQAPQASSSIAPAMPTGGGADPAVQSTAQALESRQLEAAKVAIDRAVADAGLTANVSTSIDQRGLSVRLSTDGVLFASGSATIQSEGARLLVPIAASLRGLPNPVRVEGHTDTAPIATAVFPSNWELSGGRAAAVVRALVGGGVPSSRLELSGFGDTEPIASNDTPTGRAANRRVDVLVVRIQGGTSMTPTPAAGG